MQIKQKEILFAGGVGALECFDFPTGTSEGAVYSALTNIIPFYGEIYCMGFGQSDGWKPRSFNKIAKGNTQGGDNCINFYVNDTLIFAMVENSSTLTTFKISLATVINL